MHFHSFHSCLVASSFTFISCISVRCVNDSSRLSRVSPCPQAVRYHRLYFCFSYDSVPKFSVPVCLNSHSRSFHLLYPCHYAPYRHLFILLFLLFTGHGSVSKLRLPACRFLKNLLSFVSFTHHSSVRCSVRLNQDFVFVGAPFICVCHSLHTPTYYFFYVGRCHTGYRLSTCHTATQQPITL